MQAIDKLKTDFDDWFRRAGSNPKQSDFDRLQTLFCSSIKTIPVDTLNAFFTSFLSRISSDASNNKAALEWLLTLSSILMQDYDNSELSKDEWEEIRDIITLDAGSIELETLTYVLNLALEHGAI